MLISVWYLYTMNQAHEIAEKLHKATALLSREADQVLQGHLAIGLSQYKILAVVQKHPDIQQKIIAQQLNQTEASVSRQIKLLQQKGMVMSLKNPDNQREHLAGLTMKGARFITAADKILDSYYQTLFAGLSDTQQQKLQVLLGRI